MDDNVKFKFTTEELREFYGNNIFDGTIVKRGNKNYVESLCNANPEEICNFGYDLFNLDEVEIIK